MKLSPAQDRVLCRLSEGWWISFPGCRLHSSDGHTERCGVVTLIAMKDLGVIRHKVHRVRFGNWRETGEVYTSERYVLSAAGRHYLSQNKTPAPGAK